MSILEDIKKLSDNKYIEFHSKLVPNIEIDRIIGVRVPVMRDYARKIKNSFEAKEFLKDLPHYYDDENLLHAILISDMKDCNAVLYELDRFLPYVDNWAVCDSMRPSVLKRQKQELIVKIKQWIKSDKVYTIRFAIEMLMTFYLDENFSCEYNEMVKNVKSQEYYVNMMIAFYFATALAKQWDSTVVIIEKKELDSWVHNKSIQKAIESYRITDAQKEYLRKLKV